jgi:hypothetical protein
LIRDGGESTWQSGITEGIHYMGIFLSHVIEALPEVPERGEFSYLS